MMLYSAMSVNGGIFSRRTGRYAPLISSYGSGQGGVDFIIQPCPNYIRCIWWKSFIGSFAPFVAIIKKYLCAILLSSALVTDAGLVRERRDSPLISYGAGSVGQASVSGCNSTPKIIVEDTVDANTLYKYSWQKYKQLFSALVLCSAISIDAGVFSRRTGRNSPPISSYGAGQVGAASSFNQVTSSFGGSGSSFGGSSFGGSAGGASSGPAAPVLLPSSVNLTMLPELLETTATLTTLSNPKMVSDKNLLDPLSALEKIQSLL
ncbi:unnamed protein product [Lepeophtheirus salmonis]|uniref:(salmon louse) hypothetical protein n=1 Tax=Lepeophtheirus salmonis TaxID=72036 RepID=A0A7R8CRY8_LEPSM|nr:unnamed protein product [Lepeophtheirus salmonis]CAF2860280.1 unnamed protein product [Lepeophtheirus salmonis]